MNYMLNKSGNNLDRQKEIKSNQLIGVELRPDMFSHACSNMMMRGDGKSNIYHGDCFYEDTKKKVEAHKPNKTFLNPPYIKSREYEQLEFIENALECIQKDGIAIAICQMSTAISGKADTIAVRNRLMEKHTLEAVFSMPDDLFHPVGVVTCILIFKAHTPHSDKYKTFLGYFKDDGHIKVKNKGRLDKGDKWKAIKEQWLSAYINRETITGLSVTQCLKPEDEWCAEAYMETDYSQLTDADFEKTIKDFVAHQFLTGGAHGIS